MKYGFDIDGTICETDRMDYANAKPNFERIQKVNKLYDEKHIIVYWTARGSETGIDWESMTVAQLKKWGCKFHYLLTHKPYFDLLVDDHAMNADEYFNTEVESEMEYWLKTF